MPATLLFTLEIAGAVIFVYMTALFFIALIRKRNDIADIAWGPGFVVVAWASIATNHGGSIATYLMTILISIWGLRLALHIHRRNRGKSEDFRYRQWRESWGKWFVIRSYLQVFLLQGFLMFLVVTPILISASLDISFMCTLAMALGLLIWIIGFVFESVGDAQLANHIANPANKGKLMTRGLWTYTRHPNYFGEITQWWGIFLIGLSAPYGIYGIVGPLTITTLILFVSGIPMLEKRYLGNADFDAYKRRTSAFFPLPPKRS